MKIAIITGASSGIGREFALRISEKYSLDEIWLIARRKEKLENVAQQINTKTNIIPLDLTQSDSFDILRKKLTESSPSVEVLVNCAGLGKIGTFESQSIKDIEDMVNLNIRATTVVTKISLDYMHKGSAVINMSSVSGFLPLPYMNIYAASKAYVLRFSQALAKELENKGISVTAVCPYWVASEFFSVAQNTVDSDSVNNFRFVTYPYSVVNRALESVKCKKIVAMCGIIPTVIKVAAAVLPFNIKMKLWEKTRRLNTSQCNQQCPEQWQLQ